VFLLEENDSGIRGTVEYNTGLYKRETILRMIDHYINLLQSIVVSPEERVGCLGMLTTAEEDILLKEFNTTKIEFQKDDSIVFLFEKQVLKTPDILSIVFKRKII